ncbi:MAG: carbamoyltransferase HypF [Planctomycetia bacterium]|nr:carbamoyltransferase HypF [Planctomycetia bacterium]
MSTESLTAATDQSRRIRVFGRVQGLGVRPAAARLAARLGLTGRVANTCDGLTVELQGAPEAIERYLAGFIEALPPGAKVERMEVEADRPRRDFSTFEIASRTEVGAGIAAVPIDRNVCATCLTEVRDPTDRRGGYPFASCTDCGPRYSIVEAMPYDRAATTMRRFMMCRTCRHEYRAADDRRFHAQTNACPQCGPQARLTDEEGRTTIGGAAIAAAASALSRGRIVALKGLGGYQLLVDATSPAAVRRLRERKRRRTKPLAVLSGSLAEAETLGVLTDTERRLLVDPAGPIVIVHRRAEARLAAEVAPDFQSIGLLLPTTPLHALLCDQVARPLVCTSGNSEGEPLVYDETRAERELRGVADLWLHHDRPIARPIDDSVVRVIAGAPCFLRLARGFAPYVLPPFSQSIDSPIIALGGEQKSAIALWNGSQAVLGSHLGDLTSGAACERWSAQLNEFAALYGVTRESAAIVHDRHPDYYTSRCAGQYRNRLSVQHHHAHVAAVLLEHGALDREVIGLAWDGTGYGDDGTVWGGETLRATSHDFQRVARLRSFALLGGEQAIREPFRVALALVCDAMGPDKAARLAWPDVVPSKVEALIDLAIRSRLFPRTSSMGRLFDGVAALALGISHSGDEGRPAVLLEQACDPRAKGSYAFQVDHRSGLIDWRPLLVGVVEDVFRGVGPGVIAMRFHRAVADLVFSTAATYADLPLVTSGGVFQNAVLGELLSARLSLRPAGWLRSLVVPPGDGGLAAGQLAVAAARRLRTKGKG